MRVAISRSQRLIADLKLFEPMKVVSVSDPIIKTFEVGVDEAIAEAFRYRSAANIDQAGLSLATVEAAIEKIEEWEASDERMAT